MLNLNEIFANNQLLGLVLIPILVFLAKVIDCTLATLSVIFTAKGNKKTATIISFFEITIYMFALVAVVENAYDLKYIISYIGGFVAGTYIGMTINEKLNSTILSIKKFTKVLFVVLYNRD